MTGLLYVALGGGIGAALRYGCGLAAERLTDAPGLWSTLFVNVAGSLAMGLFAGGWLLRGGQASGDELRLLIAVGLLGGFTTYSSYALETMQLVQVGRWGEAAAYAVGTMVICLAVFAGGVAVMSRGTP